jgi:NADH-quinone oxidoreductase subunit C
MTRRTAALVENAKAALGDAIESVVDALGEVTLEVRAADLVRAMTVLRDDPGLRFEQLIDLCGVDYSEYAEGSWEKPRFAAVYHLLSIQNNWRVRVRAFALEDAVPILDSLVDVWPTANWFEREAFDLFGIVFNGHPDLRRILTDYGFIGNPFRKDFPIAGHVEMRYDPDQGRVVYQPVTIEPRNNVPRIVRVAQYGSSE